MNKSSSIYTAVAVGAAGGFILSRLLAPMLAATSGAIRARAGGDPLDLLIADHRTIQDTLRKMDSGDNLSRARRAKLFLRLKRTLAKHALAEEDVVYPMLIESVHQESEGKQLYDEHADIKVHLYLLEQHLMHDEDWSTTVSSLRTLIDRHIRTEEDVEFPKIREHLESGQHTEVASSIRREEAMVL